MPPAWVVPLSRTLVTSFVVLNLVLIAVRPDLWIREDGISRYLVGDLRWLGVLSFVLLSALARVKARQAMTAQSPTGACAATRAVEPRWRIQAVRGRRLGRRPGSPVVEDADVWGTAQRCRYKPGRSSHPRRARDSHHRSERCPMSWVFWILFIIIWVASSGWRWRSGPLAWPVGRGTASSVTSSSASSSGPQH